MPKITKISYSKVFNLGDFQNEKIGAEVELSPGDDAAKALTEVKKFVEFSSSTFTEKYNQAKKIIENQGDHTINRVNAARDFVKEVETYSNNLITE